MRNKLSIGFAAFIFLSIVIGSIIIMLMGNDGMAYGLGLIVIVMALELIYLTSYIEKGNQLLDNLENSKSTPDIPPMPPPGYVKKVEEEKLQDNTTLGKLKRLILDQIVKGYEISTVVNSLRQIGYYDRDIEEAIRKLVDEGLIKIDDKKKEEPEIDSVIRQLDEDIEEKSQRKEEKKEVEGFPCKFCGKVLTTKGYLKKHIINMHVEEMMDDG